MLLGCRKAVAVEPRSHKIESWRTQIGGEMKFKAGLERLQDGLGWTIVRVPFEPADVWKKMVRLRVQGEVNGARFRTSLFAFSGGGYFLLVNKAVQRGANVHAGQMAEFELEPDLEERAAELPDELAAYCWTRLRGCGSGTTN